MKAYNVKVTLHYESGFEITAKNKEEAEEKALFLWNNSEHNEEPDVEIEEVEQ